MRALILAATVLATAPAAAQTNEALLDCAKIADGERRLACFDAAVAKLVPESSPIVAERRKAEAAALAARKAAEAKERADNFGREGLRLSLRKEDPEDISEIETQIGEVLKDTSGKAVFVLANGQMWRQTGGLNIGAVRAGDAVLVKRGMVGGYKLTLKRQSRTVTVSRMR